MQCQPLRLGSISNRRIQWQVAAGHSVSLTMMQRLLGRSSKSEEIIRGQPGKGLAGTPMPCEDDAFHGQRKAVEPFLLHPETGAPWMASSMTALAPK